MFKNYGASLPQYMTRLNVTLVNKTGVLNTITRRIADFDANIADFRPTCRDEDFCNLTLDIEVRDVEHVNHLLAALRGISVVSSVNRVIAEKSVYALRKRMADVDDTLIDIRPNLKKKQKAKGRK